VLAPLFVFAVEALREAAKRGSFRGLGLTTRVPVPCWAQRQKSQVGDYLQQCSCVGMPLVTGR
jgi:hypothetical protein